MKKIYTTLLATVIATLTFGQNAQIVNGGFENWTDVQLFDSPNDWISSNSDEWQGVETVLKSTEASDGNFSCEFTAKEVGSFPDTTFGYVLHGSIGPSGPDGGIPYTDIFNEVTFDYQSDLPVGDTLYMLTIRFDALGMPIEQLLLPAAYGTNATWTSGSVTVPATPQTELFFGFVLGDPFAGDYTTPDKWARVDNVKLKNAAVATTDLPNNSFEQWTTTTIEQPNNWFTMNEFLIGSGIQNATKTTDANSGSFAVELTTMYNSDWDDTIGGFVSIGSIDMNGPNPFTPIPYVASPTTFNYSYKYAPTNGDPSGGILVEFFSGGISIGQDFVNPTAQATYFTGALTLSYSGTPDSMSLIAFSGDSLGSVLKLDDLSFSGGDVGIEEFKKLSTNVYPNPASDYVMIKANGSYSIEMIDVTGKVVHSSENNFGVLTVDTVNFKTGAYFIRINTESGIKTHKLIIQ